MWVDKNAEMAYCHPRLGGGAHEVGGGHWSICLPTSP